MRKQWIAAISATACLSLGLATAPVSATPQHHTGFLHRHPTLSAAAAGLAAHHYAKRGAMSRRGQGRRPNFAERHPILSGIGAAAATHHVLKKH